ncbi:Uu.00g092920.m01.CDS01 [Anthostomella pinea]|uniref:Uu.00g092920.m01.CDS01 n=1 Tax=Anthostomella pinea TaxID=933095 RepID=A0AAI8VNC1_9PEZI|nr:Uu.00g092920.m01.CDS01 [Anthostomella pinea]
MGRGRKKNRHGKSNGNPNTTTARTSARNLDRDDDYPMHGVDNPTPGPKRRSPNKTDHNRGAKNRNPFDVPFPATKRGNHHNPFNSPRVQTRNPAWPGQHQNPHLRRNTQDQRHNNRNQNHPRHHHHHHHHGRRRSSTSSTSSTTSSLLAAFAAEGETPPRSPNPAAHHQSWPYPASFPYPHQSNPNASSSTSRTRSRFCTECRDVRQSNLALRDWLARTLRARITRWSDEVGVGFGAADEMDWQPEPVVRVLILGVGNADECGSGQGYGYGYGEGYGYGQGYGVQQQQQQQQRQQLYGQGDGLAGGPSANPGLTPSPGTATSPSPTNMAMGGSAISAGPVLANAARWGLVSPWSSAGAWDAGPGRGGVPAPAPAPVVTAAGHVGGSVEATPGVWQCQSGGQADTRVLTPPKSPSDF